MRTLAISILALGALVAAARADTIILKNGSKLEGTIVKETPDQVVILVTDVGKLSVDRRRIKDIQRDERGAEKPKKSRPARPG